MDEVNFCNGLVKTSVKNVTPIKRKHTTASIVSGAYYAFYNIMIIYTVADFPMWQKCVITFVCNVIGVFVVKWAEEKSRKDKLWKVEATIPNEYKVAVNFDLADIPHSYIEGIGKYTIFNFYCATQAESAKVRDIINQYNAKYFVSESKNL